MTTTTALPTIREALKEEILRLKKDKNIVLLAHYYQENDIQDLADFVGDSLELSRKAKEAQADIIVFAGVHFMGETAKILNPKSKVIIPDLAASCSLAESCPPDVFADFLAEYPDHLVISYINCSAEVKALSDIICTSSNAVKIVNSVPAEQPIIFAPDKNLGRFVMKETGRKMLLWDGACIVHEAFEIDKILELHKQHPHAKFIAHPEAEEHILKVASFVGSTSAMIRYVKEDEADEYIVATEAGILHQMRKEAPHKKLIPAPIKEETDCGCSECAFMKMNTLEKLYQSMRDETPEIILDEDIRAKALAPIERMLELS
jgi:quinolinate synthase